MMAGERPLCSVILPAFDCEDVLPAAIESVLAQSEPRIELIVVDDASTDASAAIAHRYARADPRVQVLRNRRNSRAGPVEWEPRNDGLRVASGAFVAYLDADNSWRPDFLTRLAGELLAAPSLQLVFCDSQNHYSRGWAERAVAHDKRMLVARGTTWTVFSLDALDRRRLGVDQYIDTNELMHRATVFARLGALWRVVHPRRDEVARHQYSFRCGRRHNDLDLVERIVDAFGVDAVGHVREVLVDYYYPSARRRLRPAPCAPIIHPQTESGLGAITLDRLYGHQAEVAVDHDLGVGEIRVPGLALSERYEAFMGSGRGGDRLLRYRGSSTVTEEREALARHFAELLPGLALNTEHVVCFDGCHEAIGAAADVFTGSLDNRFGRDAVAYAVPAYPYWTIATAGRHRGIALEAHSAPEHVAALESLRDSDVGAVIVNWPNSPLGYSYSAVDAEKISRCARERGWGIVADITYSRFLDGRARTAIAALAPERTIYCDSISKAWGMPGLRLGFGVSADARLAAALGMYKSARTLMPSSLKLAFFGHLLQTAPEIPARIVATIHARRARLRNALDGLSLELGLTPELRPGLYEVLFVDRLCEAVGETPDGLVARLLRDAAMRTAPDSVFFPPGYARRDGGRFLRLSVGRCDDLDEVAARLILHVRASGWVTS